MHCLGLTRGLPGLTPTCSTSMPQSFKLEASIAEKSPYHPVFDSAEDRFSFQVLHLLTTGTAAAFPSPSPLPACQVMNAHDYKYLYNIRKTCLNQGSSCSLLDNGDTYGNEHTFEAASIAVAAALQVRQAHSSRTHSADCCHIPLPPHLFNQSSPQDPLPDLHCLARAACRRCRRLMVWCRARPTTPWSAAVLPATMLAAAGSPTLAVRCRAGAAAADARAAATSARASVCSTPWPSLPSTPGHAGA